MSDDARSSTSSHFTKDYETASAGAAESEFLGIPLNNDLSMAHPIKLAGLALLLLVLVAKPKIARRELSAAFWVAILGAAYVLREVALFPLLTTVVYTRTAYPYLVVIPHCIVAAASYRSLRGNTSHYLESFGLGFFCWGFGGSIVSDVLMGLPATALGHYRILPCYILGWALVWFSPFDVVYKKLSDPNSFVKTFFMACEAVDAVTTPMGRISRGARELQNKVTAPLMAGLFAGIGGGMIRFVVLEGDKAPLFAAIETGVWRTLGYSLLWWWLVVRSCDDGSIDPDENHCGAYNGSDWLRVAIVTSHVVWTLVCDMGLARGHPFIWGSQQLRGVGANIAKMLHLGPQAETKQAKTEKKE